MLKIENATKRFGGLTAVDKVFLELEPSGITGLVGPNGSGKSTLFHMITGFYPMDAGTIYFRDRKISGLRPDQISRLGLVRTFQQTRILPFLTVSENLMAASPAQTGECLTNIFLRPGRIKRDEKLNREEAEDILEILKLKTLTHRLAGHLSYGQQKLIELGRVLMAKPKMILLDEPAAGINPTLINQLVAVLKELTHRGILIFLIEHNMPLVVEICTKVFVMDSGSLIFAGPPAEAQQNQQVIEAYLGKEDHAA